MSVHARGNQLRKSVKSRLEVGEFLQSRSTPYFPNPESYTGELVFVHNRHYAIGKLLYKPRHGEGLWVYLGQCLASTPPENDHYLVVDSEHRVFAVPMSEVE